MKSRDRAAIMVTVKNSDNMTNLRSSESVSSFIVADSGMNAITAKVRHTEKDAKAKDSLYSAVTLRVNHAIIKDPKIIKTMDML